MGDIEKFFNENFFQKTSSARSTNEVFKKDKFNGVPESHYEPTTFKSPPGFKTIGRTGPQPPPESKTTTEFSLGGLSGMGRFGSLESTSPKSENNQNGKLQPFFYIPVHGVTFQIPYPSLKTQNQAINVEKNAKITVLVDKLFESISALSNDQVINLIWINPFDHSKQLLFHRQSHYMIFVLNK